MSAAGTELARLDFTLTPFSEQMHRVTPDSPLTPAGTGNQCVMLQNGYLEFLTPLADTPNARQLRAAMARYTGVHLLAFGTDDAHTSHAQLVAGDFAPLPPLSLQREVGSVDGTATARFTVVRVPPDAMSEGRIQYCQHHTRDVVWQPRWLNHANGATGLAGVVIAASNPDDTARRYEHFTGLPARPHGAGWRIATARGYVLITSAQALEATLGLTAPALPWIAGYVIESSNMKQTRAQLASTNTRTVGDGVLVTLSSALGGFMLFAAAGSEPIAINGN